MASNRIMPPFSRSPAKNIWSGIPPALTRLSPAISSNQPSIPARLLLTQMGGSVPNTLAILTATKFNLWPLRRLVFSSWTLSFLHKVGDIAAACRHEPRERQWLMEQLSIAILRGKEKAILHASLNSHSH